MQSNLLDTMQEGNIAEPGYRQSSKTNEHYTPAIYVRTARRAMGGIDLDPASCELAQRTVQAATHYTKAENGLLKPWRGRVWLNPPYGKVRGVSSVDLWAGKLLDEHRRGRVVESIFLCGSNHSQLSNVQAMMAHAKALTCVTNHRIEFEGETGAPQESPPGNNLFVYLGERGEIFAAEFRQFGVILVGAA